MAAGSAKYKKEVSIEHPFQLDCHDPEVLPICLDTKLLLACFVFLLEYLLVVLAEVS